MEQYVISDELLVKNVPGVRSLLVYKAAELIKTAYEAKTPYKASDDREFIIDEDGEDVEVFYLENEQSVTDEDWKWLLCDVTTTAEKYIVKMLEKGHDPLEILHTTNFQTAYLLEINTEEPNEQEEDRTATSGQGSEADPKALVSD